MASIQDIFNLWIEERRLESRGEERKKRKEEEYLLFIRHVRRSHSGEEEDEEEEQAQTACDREAERSKETNEK